MKLYYSPGACSLSPHIVLQELGIPIELVKVDLASEKEADGTDYRTHNPKGYVPALQLDNGELLTEGVAIVQYLADSMPEKNLAPANGTLERYRLQEMLNFISSEIHPVGPPLTGHSMRCRNGSHYVFLDLVLGSESRPFLY